MANHDDLAERVREASEGDGGRLSRLGLRFSVELGSETQALGEVLCDGPTEHDINELVLAKLSPRRRAQKRATIRQRRARLRDQNTPGTT